MNRDQIEHQLLHSSVFKAGASAYYDAFRWIVPVKVLEVIEPGNGIVVGSGKLKIEVKKDTGPYRKGEILESSGFTVFPTSHRKIRDGQYYINKFYKWEKNNND